MLEVNAGTGRARHKLRESGDAALVVDGPPGFAVVIQVADGAACTYSRTAGLGATGLIGVGSQITATSRTIIRTTGDRSVVDVIPKAA